MNTNEIYWGASLNDMKRGFSEDSDHFICLLCGEKIEKGIIYSCYDRLLEASKYMQVHILNTHKSVFEFINSQDKKITGLSEHQSKLIGLFYSGKNDIEIQNEMKIGSQSTIRNHRFALKEKEKQAKSFLVLMELLKEKNKYISNLTTNSSNINSLEVEDVTNDQEREKILEKYFTFEPYLKLKTFKMKEKSRIVVLGKIAECFEVGRKYTEKEINEIISRIYESDYVAVRRYLIEYGFMDRQANGKAYWIKENIKMKKEIKYKIKLNDIVISGVFQIRNKINNKIFIGSCRNVKSLNGIKFQLNNGSYTNISLQKEWSEFGENEFEFEILETFEEKEDGTASSREAKKMEREWIERSQPFGDRGYNKPKVIKK
jgi:hypothetical protein